MPIALYRCRAGLALIATTLALLSSGCGRIAFDPTEELGSEWWDPTWTYRKALTIDAGKVYGDLADFPVLINLADPDLASANPTGSDLRFVEASALPLAYEIEKLSVPKLVAWVKVPALSPTAATTIYMYYGNATAADAQDAKSVWSGYVGVFHFGDVDPLDVHDSTGVNNGINFGATTATGQILGAAGFSGSVNIGATAVGVDQTPGGSNTVSFWMNYADPLGKATFAFIDNNQGYDLWMVAPDCFGFNTENGDVLGTASLGRPPPNNRWVHVVAVFYNGVPDSLHNQLWLDGVNQPLTLCSGTSSLSRRAGDMLWASGGTYQFTGLLDEGRVAAGVRSPAWIFAELSTQNDPTFVTIGAEQLRP